MQPRPYQSQAVVRIREACLSGPVCAVAPTGSGKTVIACMILDAAALKGSKSLIVAHTREIIQQTAARFMAAGLHTGVVMAGTRPDPTAMVQVASIQTLARRDFPDVRIVILDECHHAVSDSYKRLIDHYLARKAVIIGLTATPERLDGRGLGTVGFNSLVQVATAPDMIEQGFLARPQILVPPPKPIIEEVARGDYTPRALTDFARRLEGDPIEHYLNHAQGRKGVVFACNIEHSLSMVERFKEAGVRADHIDGETPRAKRDALLAALRAGDLDLLSNCMILGEGWDLPDLEVAILARPTKSRALHRQQIGRIMRPVPGKHALVIDHAGNTPRLGPPWWEPDWTLEGRQKRAKSERDPDALGIRFCPNCFEPYTPPQPHCLGCGTQLQTPQQIAESEAQLVDYERAQEDREATYAALVGAAWSGWRRIGWARHAYKDRYGVWPRNLGHVETANYPCVNHEPETATYGPRTTLRCVKCLRTINPSANHPRPGLPS